MTEVTKRRTPARRKFRNMGLACPHCGGKTAVTRAGRPYVKDAVIRERRCVSGSCGMQFKSVEKIS